MSVRVGLVVGLIFTLTAASLAAPARPQFLLQNGHTSLLRAVAWSPAGDTILTAGDEGTGKLWDPATGHVKGTLPVKYWAIKSIAFSPDGREAAIAHEGGLRLFDVATTQIAADLSFQNVPTVVRYNPDGKTLATADSSGHVVLWDRKTRKASATYTVNASSIEAVAFSPDGKSLAVSMRTAVHVLDAASMKKSRVLEGPKENITSVAWSPDGKWVAAAESHTIWLWDAATGQARTPIGGFAYGPAPIVFSPDSKTLAAGDGDSSGSWIKLCDVAGGKIARTVQVTNPVADLAFSPDGKSLGVAIKSYEGLVMSLPDLDIRTRLGGHSRSVTCVAISPDHKTMATGGWDNAVKMWDLGTGRIRTSLKGFSYGIWSVAFSPDNRLLATGSGEGLVQIWDAASGRLVHALEGHRREDMLVAFSPDGSLLATAGENREVTLWDTATWKEHATIRLDKGSAGALSFNKEGTRLAGATGRHVYLWHTRNGKEMGHMLDSYHVELVAFSPDGKDLAVSVDNDIKIFDWDTQDLVATLEGKPHARIYSLAYHPEGHLLAAGDMFGNIILWDVAQKKVVRTFEAHNAYTHSLAFGPSGSWLVSLGDDGMIRFWDPSSGKLLVSAVEMDQGENWVVVSPDGQFDGSPGGQRLIEWRIGDKVFSLEQFFNSAYVPGLLARVLGGQTSQAPVDVASLPAPPRVRILSPASGDRIKGFSGTVTVKLEDQGGGIATPSLYLNGHRLPASRAMVSPSGEVTFSVSLVEGKNRLRATAFNRGGSIESRGDEIVISCDATATRQPVLHVLAVGVDQYQNSSMRLGFARADAEAIAHFFKPGLFGDVQVRILTDAQATRSAILQQLRAIGQAAEPQDVVVLYLAGHGTLIGDVFFYLPVDAKIESDESIRNTGLSFVDLGNELVDIKATKQIMIVDACHSGASTAALPSPVARGDAVDVVRAQERLAHSTGTFLIAASTAKQYAKEIPDLGHGLLTYAILHGLGEKGQPAASVNAEGQVTVNSLLRFVTDEVPNLAAKYQGGRQDVVQYSNGQDFPLVVAPH